MYNTNNIETYSLKGERKGNEVMIKFTTIENRTVYVNPSLIASIEIAEQVVHMQVGDQWYKLKETEDEIVAKLMIPRYAVVTGPTTNSYERF